MFQNKQTEEIKLIDGQIIASLLFGISLILSILLLYNQRKNILEEEPLFDHHQTNQLALMNKLLAIILLGYFLYVSYITYIDNKGTKGEEDAGLQLLSSTLVFIASLVTLSVILKNYQGTIPFVDIENPEV